MAQQATDVKDRIIETARTLFIQKGFDGTSIRDIATESQTNLAMVNYYFKSKYNLFEIIFEDFINVLTGRIFPILTEGDKDFFQMIDEWIDVYYDILMTHPYMPLFVLHELNQNPQKLAERIISRNPELIMNLLCERIEREIAAGTIRTVAPKNLLLNIVSLCLFPFIFKEMAVNVSETSNEQYMALISAHREEVKIFIRRAIMP